jgi:hypothetical protein
LAVTFLGDFNLMADRSKVNSMKHAVARPTLFLLSLASAMVLLQKPSPADPRAPQQMGTPVVVELFTSEGCSSCPPADALLARLSEGPLAGNLQLIALEEHVDYWNDQGWIDPFSSRDWTTRQSVYAGTLGNRNPYTPQMVVDGTVEFVGNHSQQARDLILKAASKAKIPVMLTQVNLDSQGKGNFSAKVGKLEGVSQGDAAEVWLAITETGLHSAVTRGENAGEELRHAAVVRSMRKIGEAKNSGEISFTGEASASLPKDWKRENLRAVLLLQEKKSRRILGATEIRLGQ